jgi:hypothetical protein
MEIRYVINREYKVYIMEIWYAINREYMVYIMEKIIDIVNREYKII